MHERTRARLAAIVTSYPDPIVGEDLDGIITDWNPAAERLYGYSADEAVGQSIALIFPPDRLDEVDRLLGKVRNGEQVERFETVRRAKDGRSIDVSLTIFPIVDDRGEVVGASATARDITERKAAEAALNAARQQTQEILERITDAFVTLDREWRLTYANQAAERFLGRGQADLLGRSIWDELGLTDDSPFVKVCRQAMADGRATNVEFHYPASNAWLDARIDPAPDGLAIFVRDITRNHQLTQELHASEAKYRALIDQLPAVVYLLGADERETPIYYSPYVANLVGLSPEEVIQLESDAHWLDFIHPDDRARVAALNARTMQSGEQFREEYRLLRKDGTYVWVRDVSVPISDDDGAIVAWQGVLLDISDRIEAEEAQARLAAIVESAEDAIISRMPDGTVTSWNRGAERLYGWTAEEMIGQSFLRLLPDWEAIDAQEPFEEFDDQPKRFEAQRRRADGTQIEVAVSLSPTRDRQGAIVGVSSISRDITERKRAEEALRIALDEAQAATRAKTRFLAMLSHELRTPLQAVLGYADLLLNAPQSSLNLEEREDIGYIHQGATRMVTLIEQMLDLSRMEAGWLELDVKDVDIAEIVEAVRQDVAPQAEAKGLALTIAVSPELPAIRGDAGRLRQILLNLAGNAVKFTERGEVRITVDSAPVGGIDIAVCDSGIGIAPDDLERIFGEFQQIDSAATRLHGGAGLGLAIARGLAEQMGGQISVTSRPGSGSTFTLHLPGDG